MTGVPREEDAPDVEAIIAGIRRDIAAASADYDKATAGSSALTPEQIEHSVKVSNSLHELLAAANATAVVGKVPPAGGLKGFFHRRIFAAMIPLMEELKEHHIQVVRFMNKLVRILDGLDTQDSSELLLKTQRRIDLMTQFCNRVSALDDLHIDERLKALEEKVAKGSLSPDHAREKE